MEVDMGSTVALQTNGVGKGRVAVDGADLSSSVSGVSVRVGAGGVTEVELTLTAASLDDIQLTGANVSVKGVSMPVSVEMALYKHLAAKYGSVEFDSTTLDGDMRRFALKSV